MTYSDVISKISSLLSTIGVNIKPSNYDGVIVKELKASNTLDEGRSGTKQTHMAITGKQMDMFPHLRADGYFFVDADKIDSGLKNYFVAQIPVRIYKANVDYLTDYQDSEIAFDGNTYIETKVSVERSRRKGQEDQIQFSLTSLDDDRFVKFRKMLHVGYYFVLLKVKGQLIYECFGIKPSQENTAFLSEVNNEFYKASGSTRVDLKGTFLSKTEGVDSDIPYAWYVGASFTDENKKSVDYTDLFISEGRWENGWDDKYIDSVNKMKPGDRIAIKASYTKKNGLPFNNNGKTVGVMGIKAIGTIVENCNNGKDIKVDWEPVVPIKEWYGAGVLLQTVHYVDANDGYLRKSLLNFTFGNAKQDYSICEDRYADEIITDADDFEDGGSAVNSPRTRKTHTLNRILYGAPGTGKTYITAEYALAIIENRPVDFSEKTPEQRARLMEKYRSYVQNKQIVFTTFHQSYGYEDFIQGLRPNTANGGLSFEPVDGVFKAIANLAIKDAENDYVIIIDEINRANISKVFGELITLIEDDKRWGEINAVNVTLPSGENFAVPNNLYIIGTMNSADKSISLIDAALRRRFEFIEVVPNAELVEDKDLRGVLTKLNENLVKELDSTDLLIGHAYFMGKTVDNLCDIMNHSIIPLLYEYFYDSRKKVKQHIESAVSGLGFELKNEIVGRLKLVKKN